MASTGNISISMRRRGRTSIWAHVIERIGLAMMGASCGLFVAAHLASVAFDKMGTLGSVFVMTVYGAIGGYLGIDLPHRTARTRKTDPVTAPKTDSVELLSAAGTFLAALTAMMSVYIVVFDQVPEVMWTTVIGFWWLFGVTMQIAAGMMARMRKTDAATR